MVMYLLKDNILIYCLILVSSSRSFAQQYTQFSNYLINSVTINSAYAGSKPGVELMATYRQQWNSIEGSPRTYSVSGHGLIQGSNVGLGGVVIKDKIGLTDNLYVTLSGSYAIKMDNITVNFGLNAGVQSHSTDFDQVVTIQQNDDAFSGNSKNQFSPIIGSGIYLYNDNLYIGLSSPDLIQNTSDEQTFYRKKRHYYFSIGKVFKLSESVKIKPSLLTKITKSAPLQFDFSGTIILHNTLGVGMSYRTRAGFVAFAQVFIHQKWTIAYAFDQMTNNLSSIQGGSHEITLLHRLHNKQKTIYSPRYF